MHIKDLQSEVFFWFSFMNNRSKKFSFLFRKDQWVEDSGKKKCCIKVRW